MSASNSNFYQKNTPNKTEFRVINFSSQSPKKEKNYFFHIISAIITILVIFFIYKAFAKQNVGTANNISLDYDTNSVKLENGKLQCIEDDRIFQWHKGLQMWECKKPTDSVFGELDKNNIKINDSGNLECKENGKVLYWNGKDNQWSCGDASNTNFILTDSGLELDKNKLSIDSPTCSGTDKLQWNGSKFICSSDKDEDKQILSFLNNKLSIENGNEINLSSYNQTLSFDEDNSELSISNGNTIDLSDLKHSQLSDLENDDHTQYALLAGRAGGQTLIGGSGSGESITLQSTSDTTKGKIFFGSNSAYDEVNNRLGIGTTNPLSKFQLNAGGNSSLSSTSAFAFIKSEAEPYGMFMGIAGNGNSWFQSGLRDESEKYSISLQPRGGNVGIGTVTPYGRLNTLALASADKMTLGTTSESGLSITSPNGNNYGMYFGVNQSSGNSWIQAGRGDTATAYNMSLQASGGNVGIGTASPTTLLHLNNTTQSNTQLKMSFAGGASNTVLGGSYGYLNIKPSVNNYGLVVRNDASDSYYATIGANNGYASFGYNNVMGTKSLNITTDGNLGIGTTTPTAKTHIKGSTSDNTAYSLKIDDSSNASLMQVRNDGAVFLNKITGSTGGSDLRYNTSTKEIFYDTSSKRYKENITENVDASWLYNVPVVQYDRKDGSRKNEIGIIAEELEKIKPDYVTYNEEGKVEGYSKSDLVPAILKLVQEQKEKIDKIGDNSSSSSLNNKIGDDKEKCDKEKAGTFRYNSDENNSYVDMCMQTGKDDYNWENIKKNHWE